MGGIILILAVQWLIRVSMTELPCFVVTKIDILVTNHRKITIDTLTRKILAQPEIFLCKSSECNKENC